ncbi:MAG TPA: S8 family serine peptidase [Actinophytocola sp.]|uniref:S8 family peptidase n=1 Tax=Actinophytocola sp. TaxID=1872138 RepID=UPI002DDD64E4|nr:S8 family serine peptidase [Actinophytocola sp.]HEV2778791.1 S8 family serine peptidase [Actinophytocola sp.]
MGASEGSSAGSLRRLVGLGFAAAALVAASVASPAAAAEGQVLNAGAADTIKDSYVVVFRDSVSAQSIDSQVRASTSKYGGQVKHTYRAALRGFAASMTEQQARRLAADPAVAYVQQDQVVRITDVQPNPPSWGLDRVDQRDLPLDSSYTHNPAGTANVTAYIIDTGIRTTHQDFGGRAVWGTNTTGDGNNTDCNGHGTHVAGTVGGTAHGLAKNVRLVAVKVLNCQGSGSLAGVTAGIDFVTQQHQAGQPAVANMSLGASGTNATMENAVRNSVADGVVYAIASGNSNSDACNFTPARTPEAITVNASDINDARASFSNFGTCTDIFAPGVSITSSWNTSDTATNTISGTSMATPHVAGAAALILGGSPGLTPAQVATTMVNNATPNKITSPGTGSPNRLLFTNPTNNPGVPSVANPGNQTGTVGSPVSLQLSASGGTPPYTWSATGLPPGLSINASTGLISGTPTTAGTFSVTATARDTANQAGSTSFTWTITAPGTGCAPATNGTDFAIRDLATVSSPITISGCSGAGSATATIEVHIQHTWIGDLVVDLIAPDGTVYNLHNRSGGSADNINQTYTRNLSGETANGTWNLRVRDAAFLDQGVLDSWTLDL